MTDDIRAVNIQIGSQSNPVIWQTYNASTASYQSATYYRETNIDTCVSSEQLNILTAASFADEDLNPFVLMVGLTDCQTDPLTTETTTSISRYSRIRREIDDTIDNLRNRSETLCQAIQNTTKNLEFQKRDCQNHGLLVCFYFCFFVFLFFYFFIFLCVCVCV